MAGKAIAARDTEAPEFRAFVSVSDYIPSGLETLCVVVFCYCLAKFRTTRSGKRGPHIKRVSSPV
jgi:hypothetical protein